MQAEVNPKLCGEIQKYDWEQTGKGRHVQQTLNDGKHKYAQGQIKLIGSIAKTGNVNLKYDTWREIFKIKTGNN